jgi:transcriptional regulator with XRE-family HTH domain
LNRFAEVDRENLVRLRRRKALSQRELGRAAGLAHDTIERGERNAQMKTIRKLAEALGVEPYELMAGNDL